MQTVADWDYRSLAEQGNMVMLMLMLMRHIFVSVRCMHARANFTVRVVS